MRRVSRKKMRFFFVKLLTLVRVDKKRHSYEHLNYYIRKNFTLVVQKNAKFFGIKSPILNLELFYG